MTQSNVFKLKCRTRFEERGEQYAQYFDEVYHDGDYKYSST